MNEETPRADTLVSRAVDSRMDQEGVMKGVCIIKKGKARLMTLGRPDGISSDY